MPKSKKPIRAQARDDLQTVELLTEPCASVGVNKTWVTTKSTGTLRGASPTAPDQLIAIAADRLDSSSMDPEDQIRTARDTCPPPPANFDHSALLGRPL